MRAYDRIAAGYAAARGVEIGVPEVQAFAAPLARGARVLDVGCGNGLPLTRTLTAMGLEVVGIDSSAEMLERFRVNCPDVRCYWGPIQTCSLQGEAAFAAAIAWGVLFHLTHAEQAEAIARIASLLEPGGRFLFTAGGEQGSSEGAPMNGVVFRYWSFSVEGYRDLLALHDLELGSVEVDAHQNRHYVATKR